MNNKNIKNMPEEYWRKRLTPEQYHVLREKGTEAPFTNKFYKNFEKGMYVCGACGQELFSSDTKFDSDCGWPSFDRSLEGNVELRDDKSSGMIRTEVLCNNCGSHLGHVFDDGPKETTGKRFCINSASLNFKGLDEDIYRAEQEDLKNIAKIDKELPKVRKKQRQSAEIKPRSSKNPEVSS